MSSAHFGDQHRYSRAAQLGGAYYNPPVSQPHGQKRKPREDEDEVEQQTRFSNSFKKLRLQHGGQSPLPSLTAGGAIRQAEPVSHDPQLAQTRQPYLKSPARHNDQADLMSVEDSGSRVFVHDLDAEVAQIEAEEARHAVGMHLIPEADGFARIPHHLLKQKKKEADSNMQLILYREPASISLPEEQDAVRKTILEARKRARERQEEGRLRRQLGEPVVYALDQAATNNNLVTFQHEDEDMMDID